MHARTSFPSAALLLLFLACSGDDTSGPPRIDEVQITTVAGATEIEVERGATVQLRARALRSGSEVAGIQFQWRSEAPAIATVNANGLVQGVGMGEAEIVAEPVGAVGPAGRAAVSVVGPAVARIDISPESAWVDIGDTLTLSAIPRNAAGAQLSGADLTWRSSSAILTVDASGRVRGEMPGIAEVEAEAWNGVKGTARVRVTPVTGLAPDTGRYGAVMRIQGAGLPTGISRVEFTAASGGGRVPAFIRSVSETAVEVWVPAESGTGPIWLVGATDSFPTSRRFGVTANDDIFEGGNCGGLACAYVVPVPYHNPSLLAALGDEDIFTFTLEQPSPISIYLVDRGPKTLTATVDAFVIRVDPLAVPSYMLAVDLVQREHLDSVVYSHASLPPGRYDISIVGISLTQQGFARRPYGLTITTTANFEIAPDAFEPNDTPLEAAAAPITLPFDQSELAAENPYAVDTYVFDVAVPSVVTASVSASGGDLELFLLRGDSVDTYRAGTNDIVAAAATVGSSDETVQGTVMPGRYTVAVHEFGGQAVTYRLQITATPAPPAGPFTLSAPAPPRSEGRGFSALARLRPERPVPVRLPER